MKTLSLGNMKVAAFQQSFIYKIRGQDRLEQEALVLQPLSYALLTSHHPSQTYSLYANTEMKTAFS